MNQRKLAVKTVGSGIFVILANLAFAPIFHAGANPAPTLTHAASNTIASADEPKRNSNALRPQPQPPRYQKTFPAQPTAPQSAQPEQQVAPTEPRAEPKHDNFDGRTTFAVNENDGRSASGSDSDTRIFGALGAGFAGGTGTGGSPSSSTPQDHADHAQASGPNGQSGSQPSDEHNPPVPGPQHRTQDESNHTPQSDAQDDTKPAASVPEPSALALLFIGACGLIAARRFV